MRKKSEYEQEAKTLWKTCFDDSQDFIDFYFEHKSDIDSLRFLANLKSNKLESSMLLIPYSMTYFGENIKTKYVSGAGTEPDYRKKGCMDLLLRKCIKEMYINGTDLCTLIPANRKLFDYYQKTNFATLFKKEYVEYDNKFGFKAYDIKIKEIELACPKEDMPNTREGVVREQRKAKLKDWLFPFMKKGMKQCQFGIQHTNSDYEEIIADLLVDNGKVITAFKNGELKSVALAYCCNDNTCYSIEEIINPSCTMDYELCIVNYLIQNSHIKTVRVRQHNTNKGEDYGMGRIINLTHLLKIYARHNPEMELSMNVYDPIIDENCGQYYISKGKMTKKGMPCKPIKEVDITQLVNILIHDEKKPKEAAYISLMMEN